MCKIVRLESSVPSAMSSGSSSVGRRVMPISTGSDALMIVLEGRPGVVVG
jgi:hypothetical protein